MSLVTVVVPIYNVAPYLEACLDSIAAQSYPDLDVVLVDDGSTDGSERIAERYVERDARFRLHRQPNGGLGNARNSGIALARGDYLSFVDSDDLLAPDAYERLVGSLVATGSDVVIGRFRRLTPAGSRPAFFVGQTFARDRRRTNISDFHELAVDRTAWGKVFRRSFWDTHGFRFGEGVSYEDYYATLPAYFLADGVDVLSTTVYYWRIRDAVEPSISQRREQPREVVDRVTAVHATTDFLARSFPEDKAWYERMALLIDLNYAADVLVAAAPEDQRELLQRLQIWYAQTEPEASEALPLVPRLSWELIRRGAVDDLATLLEQAPTDGRPVPVRRRRGGWVADVSLKERLPASSFRVDDELGGLATLTGIESTGDLLKLRGVVEFPALRPVSRFRRRLLAWLTEPSGRCIELSMQPADDDDFVITVPVSDVLDAGHGDTTWTLHVELRQRGLRCELGVKASDPPAASCVSRTADGRLLRTEVGSSAVRLHAQAPTEWVASAVVDGDVLRLQVSSPAPPAADAALLLVGSSERRIRVPVVPVSDGWSATLPVADLSDGIADPTAPQTCRRADAVQWTLTLIDGERRRQVWHPAGEQPVSCGPVREVRWSVNAAGLSVLVDRRRRPLLTGVEADGPDVVLTLDVPSGVQPAGYVALGAGGVEHAVAERSGDTSTVRIVVPADLAVHGPWRVGWRDPDGPTPATHVGVTPGCLEQPVDLVVGAMQLRIGRDRNGAVVIAPSR